MSATREQVFEALFAKLQSVPGITSFSRRFTLPAQVPPAQQPRLMLWEQHEETEQPGRGIPAKRQWSAWIVVVFTNRDKTLPGASILNPIADAIEDALGPDQVVSNALTLGGLVHYCQIEGATVKETGDTDANGLGGLVVPVTIRVP